MCSLTLIIYTFIPKFGSFPETRVALKTEEKADGKSSYNIKN